LGLAGSWSEEDDRIILSGFPERSELTLNSMDEQFIVGDDCDAKDTSPDTSLDGVVFREVNSNEKNDS